MNPPPLFSSTACDNATLQIVFHPMIVHVGNNSSASAAAQRRRRVAQLLRLLSNGVGSNRQIQRYSPVKYDKKSENESDRIR